MILLGSKIKALRNKQKMTQSELASCVGVTKSTIAAYENNSRLPSYEILLKLADTFGVSLDYLFRDQSDVTINADGLTAEQILLMKELISQLIRSNRPKK